MKEDSFAIGIIEIPQDEYINKTWLVQKLNEAVTEIKEKVPAQPGYAAIVETLAQTINKIQPADVVEVVRCKDCVYYEPCEGGKDYCCWNECATTENDYCSSGEKMDKEE